MKINLPKVDKISNLDEFKNCFNPLILNLAKEIIENERKKAIKGEFYKNENEIIEEIKFKYKELENLELKPLINATGVVLHTNLGRSVISEKILKRAFRIISSYSNLEYDLSGGNRGLRYDYSAKLCSMLFGCEDALIVNNNASAVFLVLNTFSKDLQSVVSRGELVEIGGSFRIPEVMKNSSAILKEVGTTNKTNIKDYEEAICENTAILMKVHQSNFKIQGFSQSVGLDEIVSLAKERNIISYYDLGSGYINEMPYSLGKDEPSVDKLLKTGVDILSFSGDKLFGSVQCGIILGKKELILKLKQNQLLRMLRVDKITIAILNETLKAYINKEFRLITTQNQIHKSLEDLSKMAEFVQKNIPQKTEIITTKTFIGGGSLPCKQYPSIALVFDKEAILTEKLFREKGVIGRIEESKFLLDFRSILDENLEGLIKICKELGENL
ncbi:L-seryl-tRNA(Sec) selenium transferase [Campylobacter sp. FMV-PI01]|uniref:L-seryl-tRNA(Sec) selenium transferase n=1 Tax=Campylobacter portucalensis TaxID=2608384 RepID=A0A6L5WGM5_9BACT|nr:L-seryl-tRNA(Sec) selenium transferase [Campylobacter portucalensis]MSN95956.1 L-seryl-tRNA(Sec) selenium transferase [Campylobacter portucalensis]